MQSQLSDTQAWTQLPCTAVQYAQQTRYLITLNLKWNMCMDFFTSPGKKEKIFYMITELRDNENLMDLYQVQDSSAQFAFPGLNSV